MRSDESADPSLRLEAEIRRSCRRSEGCRHVASRHRPALALSVSSAASCGRGRRESRKGCRRLHKHDQRRNSSDELYGSSRMACHDGFPFEVFAIFDAIAHSGWHRKIRTREARADAAPHACFCQQPLTAFCEPRDAYAARSLAASFSGGIPTIDRLGENSPMIQPGVSYPQSVHRRANRRGSKCRTVLCPVSTQIKRRYIPCSHSNTNVRVLML